MAALSVAWGGALSVSACASAPSTPPSRVAPAAAATIDSARLGELLEQAWRSMPKRVQAWLVLDVRALRALVQEGPLGQSLSSAPAPADSLWVKLGQRSLEGLGVDLTRAQALVIGLDEQGQLHLWAQGPVDAAQLEREPVMVRGRLSYAVRVADQTAWLVPHPSGQSYSVLASRQDVERWLDEQSAGPAPAQAPPWLSVVSRQPAAPLHLIKPARQGSAPGDAATVLGRLDQDGVELVMRGQPQALAPLAAGLEAARQALLALAAERERGAPSGLHPEGLERQAHAHWLRRAAALMVLETSSPQERRLRMPPIWREEPLVAWSLLWSAASAHRQRALYQEREALAQQRLTMLQERVEGFVRRSQRQDASGRWSCPLPPEAGPSPKERTCCARQGGPADASGALCAPSAERWAQPGWQAIELSLQEPDPFVYELRVHGDEVILTLRGDADCDSVYSMFVARVRVRATAQGCLVEPGPALWRNTQD